MKSKVYVIRDIVMNSYSFPFFAMHENHAKRICSDLILHGEGTTVHDHPEDHDLYLIGEYDDQTGLISPENFPEFIVHLLDFATHSAPTGDTQNG